jgi:hypothetical protein
MTETVFVNNLDNFIKAAEEKIFKSVDLDYLEKMLHLLLLQMTSF